MHIVVVAPKFEDNLIGHHDGHQRRLQTLAVHKDLRQQRRLTVNVLNLFRSNVLALGQFENVLFAVDYLQCTLLSMVKENNENNEVYWSP